MGMEGNFLLPGQARQLTSPHWLVDSEVATSALHVSTIPTIAGYLLIILNRHWWTLTASSTSPPRSSVQQNPKILQCT